MTKPLDLKSTLNLPKTAFPMKANLPQAEPKMLEEWERTRIYHRIQQARAGAPAYVLHDGPPYPTGEIHLGTGLNKVLKDMVVKSKTMAGFRAPYVPGWDCHGLPIETKVEKEIGGKGKVSPAEFRRMCRDFAGRYIENHRREFKRLGVFGLWEEPYLTMNFGYEAHIAEAFLTFLERGYVFRGLKPVYWCIFDGTALAEAEVEYEDHTSPSIWVKFPVIADAAAANVGAGVDAVIWTTTPWTLPHNRALAFHPDFDYVVLETSAGHLLVAAGMVEAIKTALALEISNTRGPWKGRELESLKFQHPFLNGLRVPAVLADYVTLEQGSGIVHTAPGHGAEDFYTGQKYGLEVAAPIDDEGHYLEGLPEYKGKTVFEANPHIVELLKSRAMLLGHGKLTHSYPHCWRCHQPVIFRATEQWFIRLDNPSAPQSSLREMAQAEIKKVKWTPGWGEERIQSMVATRPDWCVSRQRYWGVPLPVFFCEGCGKQFDDYAALKNVVRWFEREGADAWFTRSPEELLPAGTKCKCGAAKWRKETDILDVWFDSGSSHYAVLGSESAGPWPADCYLEGPDQYRGWFQSSLLVALGVKDAAPYRHVVTHGWTLDEKGVPMSKSLGNALYPAEICEKWGADLLRVWVASQDYTADMRMYPAVMTQLSEAYRKIRNTIRFALSNLFDFDPNRDALPDEKLWEMDRFMLSRAAALVKNCRGWYENFEFHRVFHAIHDFCVVDLSSFYFDVLKDRLYTSAPRSVGRRSAQTVIYRIASALVRLVAPVLVFTAEEIWKFFPRRAGDPESIHMALFPAPEELDSRLDSAKMADWEKLLGVREQVLKALEGPRNSKFISSALEAKVVLRANAELSALLQSYAAHLPALFIVSQVEIVSGSNGPAPMEVEVLRAEGTKCERCWNYSTHVGENADVPTVCERCVTALVEMGLVPASK
ncbi:MAG: isoleucine--tRNA ligase [Acidobacteria bacterium]|nr:isoleucine--tRNA ligase [Acidobacteriota bacterium]